MAFVQAHFSSAHSSRRRAKRVGWQVAAAKIVARKFPKQVSLLEG